MENRQIGIFFNTSVLDGKNSGVLKKINLQMEQFNKYYKMIYISAFYNNIFEKVLSRFPLFPSMFWYNYNRLPSNLKFIYFRLIWCDSHIVRMFRYIKKTQPSCKIIVELPTYPLDFKNLITSATMLPFKLKHDYSWKKVIDYVDAFVVYNEDVHIKEKKIIKVENGLDIEKEQPRKVDEYKHRINIISVSAMRRWHRIDRFIIGLGNYYKNSGSRNVILHLVGEGPELEWIRRYVKENNLNQHVIIYGVKIGEDLDKIYDRCDFALGSLFDHYATSSSLKSREYLAKGLPFLTSAKLGEETNQLSNYIMHVTPEDKAIDIDLFIKFYDSIYGHNTLITRNSVNKVLRNFAKSNYDISIVMRPILDYIAI